MKAVIHIGTGKTGTTTIEYFLDKNREVLKSRGILIPMNACGNAAIQAELFATTCISDNSIFADDPISSFQRKITTWYRVFYTGIFNKDFTSSDQEKLWEEYWGNIKAESHEDDIVFFSDDTLSILTENEVKRINNLIAPLFNDITIILYLRRQPEWLVSAYNTCCAFGATWGISNYLDMPEDRSVLNYRRIVERWSIFGKDKLKIRIFDKREFHDHDLLSDFAHTVGFDMTGLEYAKDENISLDSTCTEFLRLLNSHYPMMQDPWTCNPDRWPIVQCIQAISEKNKKAWHLTRSEARHILDVCREGNDWIAREYLGREKLFSEDVSMYPEEVDSPHGLTLERCAEITAHLWKERCGVIHQLEQGVQNLQQDIQNLQQKNQQLATENHDNLTLLRKKYSIYWHYYRCKILAKLTLGKKRRHYKAKRDRLHEKVRRIRNLCHVK